VPAVSSFWDTASRGVLPAPLAPAAGRDGSLVARKARALAVAWRLLRPELALLTAVTATLNLWALSRNGWANEYYSAAVRSMSSSWHNFLYASFDPSGVMTVDKPPLSLWVQALSVRAFGYHPLSMLVPQALMGVASVLLTYDLVARRFGRVGGFVAGLVLAVTPMTVAISRHNNPDALLVLCCVAAVWCALRALQRESPRWLALAGVCVGLGFETKMGVALAVVPGIAGAWLVAAPRGRRLIARGLAAFTVAAVAVGGAWPALVELTPVSSRPWVAGTSDNSALSLIFGYNGLGRVDGQAGGPGGGAGAGPGGSAVFGSTPGPFRLLNSALGGQAGWLLGFALVALLALALASRLRRSDARTGWLLAVGGAFAVTAILFSAASGIFHPYYVSLLAPFTAALVGAGAAQLMRGAMSARVFGPAAIAAGVATELVVLGNYSDQLRWLPPLLIACGVLASVALAAPVGRLRPACAAPRARALAAVVALAALLIAPGAWAVDTLGYATSGTFPSGGPASAQSGPRGRGGFGTRRAVGARGRLPGPPPLGGAVPGLRAPTVQAGGIAAAPGAGGGPTAGAALPGAGAPLGGPFGSDASLARALAYINRHGGGTLAVSSQTSAAGAIIAEGAAVAGIGGFSGRESRVSVSWVAQEVRAGRIRWLLGEEATQAGPRLPDDTRAGSRAAIAAAARTCRAHTLPATTATASGTLAAATSGATITLYDCQGRAGALLRAGA
jgi:4-amino-4-deoxy-L-arabinose transferase-like glycosyltransferase